MKLTRDQKEIQRIVCAACRHDGVIVVGIRHLDSLMCNTIKLMYPNEKPSSIFIKFAHEEGFVNQFGNYLTRKEALIIAKRMNQIYRETGDDELFSENLY